MKGYEYLEIAVDESYVFFRSIINQSLVKLQLPESSDQFAGFIENLIEKSLELFRNKTTPYGFSKKNIASDKVALQIVENHEQEIVRNILKMTLPLYRIQLQVAQNEVWDSVCMFL